MKVWPIGLPAGRGQNSCRNCEEDHGGSLATPPYLNKEGDAAERFEMTAEMVLENSVSIDLEVEGDNHIFHIGAVWGSNEFERKGKFNIEDALKELDEFCDGASFVIGHNILSHDLPILNSYNPTLRLLKLPVIDTLYLLPLAFPENPYHHLVKGYKLVSDSRNHPVEDSRLVGSVFLDQWQNLRQICETDPQTIAFYRFCFERAELESGKGGGAGMAEILFRIGAPKLKSREKAAEVFKLQTAGRACPNQVERVVSEYFEDPHKFAALAYCLAWLKVAGGNSILPPWVRLNFKSVTSILKSLRDEPCGRRDCDYCLENHDPETQLRKYFPFDEFRNMPDGTPLQKTLVSETLRGRSLFAVMATGSGKSLCFQLPALVRYRCRGFLTVVISPLQALMKDQVDNLAKVLNSGVAGAVNGMLSPLERTAVLEQVRLGDIGILYISPEQLRNHTVRETLRQREIGGWVFDEAHCLSKWGHDFRPDYLYALRFIHEFSKDQKQDVPPIYCFTATAKKDVLDEVKNLCRENLGHDLKAFRGELHRSNFHYEVREVRSFEKYATIHGLLMDRLQVSVVGSAIIYCATRNKTEEIRDYLQKCGWAIEAFHGGMAVSDKRRIQDAFVKGKIPVISATNAFGMGVDKRDVRLVVHADIPGSLESYVQEIGRAGRDNKEAHCVLLYDQNDVETQFKIGALSEISKRDIAQILKGIRTVTKQTRNDEIIITPGELLRMEDVDTSFERYENWAETKVKTAVAWLERAGFVERRENRTVIFAGRPKFKTLAEVKNKLDRLDLPLSKRLVWESILQCLLRCQPDESISTDKLAGNLVGVSGIDRNKISDSRRIISILHDMAEQDLIRTGVTMSAYIRMKGKNNARRVLQRTYEIDRAMVKILREEHPDDTGGEWLTLDFRRLNQRLLDAGCAETNIEILRNLLANLSGDGRQFAEGRGSIDIRHTYRNRCQIKPHRPWAEISKIAERRRNLAFVLLDAMYECIPASKQIYGRMLVEFTLDDMAEALNKNLTVNLAEGKLLLAIDRGLLLLHEHRSIILQKGLSVFRHAMTIRVLPESRDRRYTKKDYRPLADHYKQGIFQIHIMNAYARRGLTRANDARRLVKDYFMESTKGLLRLHFPRNKKTFARATAMESYQKIVESLNNPIQQAVVTAPVDKNLLILAGPGSGKTRLVVHRCAYLIRVKRVPAGSILMLCFNHSNALAMRRRLQELIGDDAKDITVLTYHALAMRLTGRSFAERAKINSRSDIKLSEEFNKIIADAIELLQGRKELLGMDQDEVRDRLLGGYRYILVDEYQDIDPHQYQLVSALTGRTLDDPDSKISILAVGDDDQSIYGFRDANVKFIKQFKEDYGAEEFHLIVNYRSTRHIIEASNALIGCNRNRMKTDHPIRINRAREGDLPGGVWETRDPVAGGRVQQLTVNNAMDQARAVAYEIRRLKQIDPHLPEDNIAVFARNGMTCQALSAVRMALEAYAIHFSYAIKGDVPFRISRIREYAGFLDKLTLIKNEWRTATNLIDLYREDMGSRPGYWDQEVIHLLESWRLESGNSEFQVRTVIDFIYESLIEKGRENRLGNGVYLGTAHGAKGLEFPHVFILDGEWKYQDNTPDQEEDRRVYYVAMTRAMETLTLFRRRDSRNPYVDGAVSEHTFSRELSFVYKEASRDIFQKTVLLGMDDIFMDFAGRQPLDSPVHKELRELNCGDELYAKNGSKRIQLISARGIPVAQLAREATGLWLDKLGKIRKIKALGIVRRYAKDAQPGFISALKCEKWEVPVVEIYWE
jgi:ATP-dependent DNA helicase RecQ